MTAEKMESENGGVRLKRRMGLFSAVNVILAVMIGSGIFVSPSSALKYSGSVGMAIVVWISCGIVCCLGAMVYAELGTVVPRCGAEYAYFMESFGPLHKFWGRLPAFLYSFIMIAIVRPAEVAVIILTFSEYICQPILDTICLQNVEDGNAIKKIVAVMALGVITYINIRSVKLYVKMTNIFGSCKVFVCLVVIAGGIYQICKGNTKYLERGFQGTDCAPENIALAFYSGLWSYDGWTAVTVVAEEIKRPEVNIIRSILIGVPLVTILYVLMNVSYMTVLSVPEMTSVPAVAVAFGEKILGPFQFIIPLGVALSTFSCALSVQFGVTRLCYASAQDGHILQTFSYIHVDRRTPCPAVVLEGVVTFLFIVVGGITELIHFVSFLIWMFYGLAMVSLLVLRRTRPNVHRPYKVPTFIAIFIIMVAVYLSAIPFIMSPSPKYLIGASFLLCGVLLYYGLIYKKKKFCCIDKISRWIQVLFEVAPPGRMNCEKLLNSDTNK